jgi:hypothetical protein
MARPHNIYTPEYDLFWVGVLRALETEGYTREQVMDLTGVSERTLKRRLARARDVRDDFEGDGHDGPATDLPWVELVDGTRPPNPHYDLATDRLEKPAGAFRIGDGRGRLRVQHAGRGAPLDDKPEKPPPKFKPKQRKKGKKRTVPAA